MFHLKNVTKSFHDGDDVIHVARGLSWSLESGASAALMGESGAGKTTLMNLIAGFDWADSGDVVVGETLISSLSERELTEFRRSHLGVIFQKFHLVPSLSAWDNAALQARLGGCFDEDFATHLFESLGIEALAHRSPSQLSGGQQQRVAIARALMHRPALVLADEPTGNLDEASSERVIKLLVKASAEVGATLLVVTHSPAVARHVSEKWHLASGELARTA